MRSSPVWPGVVPVCSDTPTPEDFPTVVVAHLPVNWLGHLKTLSTDEWAAAIEAGDRPTNGERGAFTAGIDACIQQIRAWIEEPPA